MSKPAPPPSTTPPTYARTVAEFTRLIPHPPSSPPPPSSSTSPSTSPTWTFTTAQKAEGQGLNPNTAFGGFSLAIAVRAACSTVDTSTFKLYSLLGNFLGPTNPRKHVHIRVTPLRDTRTFVTRRIELLQDLGDEPGNGNAAATAAPQQQQRLTMSITADFQRPEKATAVTYTRRPKREWTGPEGSLTYEDAAREAVRQGLVGSEREAQEAAREAAKSVTAMLVRFEKRAAPEGWSGQSLLDVAVPPLKGDREGGEGGESGDGVGGLEMDRTERRDRCSGEWFKPRVACDDYVSALSAYAYVLDAGISLYTATWNRLGYDDLTAISSLEFALRFYTNDARWTGWLLRESFSHEAGEGRAYNEALLREDLGAGEAGKGRAGRVLVGMTQQTILRPGKALALRGSL